MVAGGVFEAGKAAILKGIEAAKSLACDTDHTGADELSFIQPPNHPHREGSGPVIASLP